MDRFERVATGALLAGAVLWGLTWMPMRAMRHIGMNGVALALISAAVAMLITAPYAWRQRGQ